MDYFRTASLHWIMDMDIHILVVLMLVYLFFYKIVSVLLVFYAHDKVRDFRKRHLFFIDEQNLLSQTKIGKEKEITIKQIKHTKHF